MKKIKKNIFLLILFQENYIFAIWKNTFFENHLMKEVISQTGFLNIL